MLGRERGASGEAIENKSESRRAQPPHGKTSETQGIDRGTFG